MVMGKGFLIDECVSLSSNMIVQPKAEVFSSTDEVSAPIFTTGNRPVIPTITTIPPPSSSSLSLSPHSPLKDIKEESVEKDIVEEKKSKGEMKKSEESKKDPKSPRQKKKDRKLKKSSSRFDPSNDEK
jgi:hypothetical protein